MANEIEGQEGLLLSADAKPRLKWTRQLHEQFVDAVEQLGGADKATPKSVMRVMGVPGLTLFHLKSHLQKYRLAKSQDSIASNKRQDLVTADRRPEENITAHASDKMSHPQFNETMLQMQEEVQKKLQEHIEVQKHLQLRIEAQGKYLQSVLRKAQETLAMYSSSSAEAKEAKAELSMLVSAVHDNERLGFIRKRVEITDSSTESCLTSLCRADLIKSDCSYSWSAESVESMDPNNSTTACEDQNVGNRTRRNGLGVREEIDLNK